MFKSAARPKILISNYISNNSNLKMFQNPLKLQPKTTVEKGNILVSQVDLRSKNKYSRSQISSQIIKIHWKFKKLTFFFKILNKKRKRISSIVWIKDSCIKSKIKEPKSHYKKTCNEEPEIRKGRRERKLSSRWNWNKTSYLRYQMKNAISLNIQRKSSGAK